MKTYRDRVKCPEGHKFVKNRRIATEGRAVRTYCVQCRRAYQIKAGPAPKQEAIKGQEGASDAKG